MTDIIEFLNNFKVPMEVEILDIKMNEYFAAYHDGRLE